MFADLMPEYWQAVCRYLPARFTAHSPIARPSTPSFSWSIEESAVLRAHLGRPCYFAGSSNSLKTALLHFESHSPTLLFDACWPNAAANEALLVQPLTIRLQHDGQILLLQLHGQEVLPLKSGPLLRLRVVQHELKAVQYQSCHFEPHCAPSAEFLLPCEGLWRGRLITLSEEGLTLDSLQTNLPPPGGRGECLLNFGDDLKMTLPVILRSRRILRSPHRHARLTLDLADLSATERQQLDSLRRLLMACGSPMAGYNAGFSVPFANAFEQ